MDKAGPYGITIGPDEAICFTENTGNRIEKITRLGDIEEVDISTVASGRLEFAKGLIIVFGLLK